MNDLHQKRQRSIMKFGFPSMLLAFVMVCILTFSALSYLTARSDDKLSQKAAENSKSYYQVEEKAYEKLAGLDQMLFECYQAADSETAYYEDIQGKIEGLDGAYEILEKQHVIGFSQVISSKQKLEVKLLVQYPKKADEGFYQMKAWKVITQEEQGDAGILKLADPENNDERKDE